MQDHPIRLFYDLGLRVTVNTDNRMVTRTTVSEEYKVLHDELGFTLDEIKELIIMGFKSAFLPYAIKRAMLSEVVNELKSFTPEQPGQQEGAAVGKTAAEDAVILSGEVGIVSMLNRFQDIPRPPGPDPAHHP